MADVIANLAVCTDPLTTSKANQTLNLIRRVLTLYNPSQLAFSFNGGKDSTVLLQLLRMAVHLEREAAVAEGHASTNPFAQSSEHGDLGGIRSFVFTHPDDFQEVHDFMHDADKQYGLQVEWLDARDFKQGLELFLKQTGVQAIILGTRNNDPNAIDQHVFCPSSNGWPAFMRINPLFEWTYHDVWGFLLAAKAPYCSLYNHGYTSLGAKRNTLPNSALKREDNTYAPAHMLADGRLERAGRSSNSHAPPQGSPGDSTRGNLQRTAILILIGDELLAGKVTDSAAQFLAQELRSIGYSITRILMLPDKVPIIAEELKRCVPAADVVLSCGGIGPTLDDVTMEAIAVALGKPLVRHPEFESRLRDMFGPALTAAHLKMAETPADVATLIDYELENGQMSRFPLLRCGNNIFVLPGVPHLMRQKWRVLKAILVAGRPAEPFHNSVFRLSVYDEASIAKSLEVVQQVAGPEVAVGSYPVTDQEDGARLLITLDSKKEELLRSASSQMRTLLPADAILGEEHDVAIL